MTPTPTPVTEVQAIRWQDDHLQLLDQRLLPQAERWLDLRDAAAVAAAIRQMVVRGAPAIGIAAGYAVALAGRSAWAVAGSGWKAAVDADLATLAASRPTAVNLFWALERLRGRIAGLPESSDPSAELLAEARAIHAEDVAANRRMGELGAGLIAPGSGVLTHCNTGALATGGYGTALGVIRAAWTAGRLAAVYADETRPWLQGARLTAWELVREGIAVELIVEGAAASLMRSGRLQWVIVGADRITANGDVANKIGTYMLAVAARHHGVRFMVVAPIATIDPALPDGSAIPIEQRSGEEVLSLAGQRIAAEGAGAWNPVFDVTPAALIDAIVTERGVVERPTREKLAALLAAS